ncbi:hypothetical protein CF392_07600 [Tamilnaduibacter salinus]|uniref:Glycosyltransferase 2-like domain-containing protein n=1 Tax=Tamilnaduibacter salinus TaxID=1484056 RepID=A0A2A2I376_9GAMM|nr:glycosyltransferase [Tamilnaduibacter salinus]PAV26087.1 hypothetical protein CF392_07600 [Tamilnaduibacter salinus]
MPLNRTLVVIPHFNNPAGLYSTLASIEQTESVDLLVVDDGSVDRPNWASVQAAFGAQGDAAVEYLPKNQGIVAALNYAVSWANSKGYEFIGRLDAGDHCVGERFAIQEAEMRSKPELVLLGCWVDVVSEQGNHLFNLRYPTRDQDIRRALHRYNPFVHPAVMIRLDAIFNVGGYPSGFPALEDWACFFELSRKGVVANYPQVLLQYVVHSDSVSTRRRRDQSKSKVRLLLKEYDASIPATIGILKSIILLLVPRSVTTTFKVWARGRGGR